MADNLPTVWRAEPHTFAKHAILRRYLEAWYPILSRQSQRAKQSSQEILFVDGFAGPGEYLNREPGSPVIALRAALDHSLEFPVPVRFLFIEEDADRCAHLQEVLSKYREQCSRSSNVVLGPPIQGECDSVLAALLDKYERDGRRFGPALAFLDQFGYSAVSMELVKRIAAYDQCEIFLYLDYKDMNRWISDPSKASSFTRTFGGEEWRKAIHLPQERRRVFLLEEYKKALDLRAKVKYVSSFAMFDKANQLLYWLIFCTNSLRGLEEMKKAMWKVDDSGGFRFSDRDEPGQLKLLRDEFDQEWLADRLAGNFPGQDVTVAQIRKYVLTATPCYLFKPALKSLEMSKDPGLTVVRAPAGRRRGTFKDDDWEQIVLRFPSRLF